MTVLVSPQIKAYRCCLSGVLPGSVLQKTGRFCHNLYLLLQGCAVGFVEIPKREDSRGYEVQTPEHQDCCADPVGTLRGAVECAQHRHDRLTQRDGGGVLTRQRHCADETGVKTLILHQVSRALLICSVPFKSIFGILAMSKDKKFFSQYPDCQRLKETGSGVSWHYG